MRNLDFEIMTFLGEKYNPIEVIKTISRKNKDAFAINLLTENNLYRFFNLENAVAIPDEVEKEDVLLYVACIINHLTEDGYDIQMAKKNGYYSLELKLGKRKAVLSDLALGV